MTEKDWQTSVKNNVFAWLKKDFFFVAEEYVLSDRRRIDLLFKDNFETHYIVELQLGTLDSDHIFRSQLYKTKVDHSLRIISKIIILCNGISQEYEDYCLRSNIEVILFSEEEMLKLNSHLGLDNKKLTKEKIYDLPTMSEKDQLNFASFNQWVSFINKNFQIQIPLELFSLYYSLTRKSFDTDVPRNNNNMPIEKLLVVSQSLLPGVKKQAFLHENMPLAIKEYIVKTVYNPETIDNAWNLVGEVDYYQEKRFLYSLASDLEFQILEKNVS